MKIRNHWIIASSIAEWNDLWPTLTLGSRDILIYTHGLVSILTPANYSRATIHVIDHRYIGILPWSTHVTIQQYISFSLNNKEHTNNGSHDLTHYRTLWAYIGIMLLTNRLSWWCSTTSNSHMTSTIHAYNQSMERGYHRAITTCTQCKDHWLVIRLIQIIKVNQILDSTSRLLWFLYRKEKNKFDIYFNSLYCVSAIEKTKVKYDCIRNCCSFCAGVWGFML